MEDVKESVKQGVSKVAGRLSGMASGVMTQLQVRWRIYFLIKIFPIKTVKIQIVIYAYWLVH